MPQIQLVSAHDHEMMMVDSELTRLDMSVRVCVRARVRKTCLRCADRCTKRYKR